MFVCLYIASEPSRSFAGQDYEEHTKFVNTPFVVLWVCSLPPPAYSARPAPPTSHSRSVEEEELELVLAMSREMAESESRERARVTTEEELEKILQLSLLDK